MPEKSTSETMEVKASSSEGEHEANILAPELHVLILTWVVFFGLLAVLYRFAWKPILTALDKREGDIRQAVEEAEKTHQEFLKINERRDQIILQAQDEAKDIIAQSRKGAVHAAKVIEQKAKEEAQIAFENSQRAIKAEVEKAEVYLRQASAEAAVELAGKLIKENLNDAKNRKLVEDLIQEI